MVFTATQRKNKSNYLVDKVTNGKYRRKAKTLLQVLGLRVLRPKLQIFVELFWVNLQSLVWSCKMRRLNQALIRIARRSYYDSKLENAKNDLRTTRKLLHTK